jgi:hypothetical protein
MKGNVDEVFSLPWAGCIVQISEYFHCELTDQLGHARNVSTLRMPLKSIGLDLGSGSISFEFRAGDAWALYGVMMDRLEKIIFESDDVVHLVERIGQQGYRSSRVWRLARSQA